MAGLRSARVRKLGEVSERYAVWAHLRDHRCRDGGVSGPIVETPSFESTAENEHRFKLLTAHRPEEAAWIRTAARERRLFAILLDREDLQPAVSRWSSDGLPQVPLNQIAVEYRALERGEKAMTTFGRTREALDHPRALYAALDGLPGETALDADANWMAAPAAPFDLHRTLWDAASDPPVVIDGTHRLIAAYWRFMLDSTDAFPHLRAFAILAGRRCAGS